MLIYTLRFLDSYKKVEIDLGKQFGRGEKFVIEAKNASRLNKYVQSAKLNGKRLQDFKFPASAYT